MGARPWIATHDVVAISEQIIDNGDLESSSVYAEGVLRWAADLHQSDLQARAQNLLAYIYSAAGKQKAAIASAEAAAMNFDTLGNRALALDSLGIKANALLRFGESQAALSLASQVREASQQLENPWGEVSSLLQIVQGHLHLGQPDPALAHAQMALSIAKAAQIPLLVPFAQIVFALALRTAGQAALAVNTLTEVVNGKISVEAAARVKSELCAALGEAGDWNAAANVAGQLIRARIHPLMLAERPLTHEVEALLRHGNRRGAAQLVEGFRSTVGDSPRYQAMLHAAEKMIAE